MKTPLSIDELLNLKKISGVKLDGFLNNKSTVFKKLNVDTDNMTEKELAALLVANPKALKRPVITDGSSVVIGFDEQGIAESLFS